METVDLRRSIIVEDVEYFVEVRRSQPRHVDRFATRCYAIIERPDHWQATVPVPDCVQALKHLWYRELLELVQHALVIVSRRRVAA